MAQKIIAKNVSISELAKILLLFGCLLSSISAAQAEEFKAKVVSVTDGDSITVLHDNNREKVIFYGIDCPELKQEYGAEARKFTDDSCYGKVVTIDVQGQDPRGRTIGRVRLSDGTDLNKELVKRGLAWWSDKYAPNDKPLKQLHIAAKTGKIGLWAIPNAIPPWIFRNGEKSVKATIRPAQQ